MTPDLYTLAHKPLRLAVSDAAVLLGAAEPDTIADVAGPVALVIDELLGHAGHEDEFIEPALERYLPDVGLEIAAQHARLGASIDAVRRQLDALVTRAIVAPGAPLALYRAFQRMAALNLLHLDHEETVVMPALWTTTPPGVLEDLMAAFQAAHPESVQLFHRWPDALTPTERVNLGVTGAALAGSPA
jgi:Hemerythrin HHE cation binding domain